MSITRWPAAFLLSLAATGCASLLGLDSGDPMPGDSGPDSDEADAADASDAGVRDASTTADAATACATGTADCNGNPADGCETNLNDPAHCGSCTNMCPPMTTCTAETCCLPGGAKCKNNADCCSDNCGSGKSGCGP